MNKEQKHEEHLQLQEYLLFAQDMARRAGDLLLKKRETATLISVTDMGHKGLVTDADLASRDFIVSEIQARYPTHRILTEESGTIEPMEKSTGAFEWIVDELDGTNNFRRGDPNFSVSIALRRESIGIVGVVYAPVFDNLYHATLDNGAFLEAQGKMRRLKVSGKDSTDMFTMSFAVGIDLNEPEHSDHVVDAIRKSGLFRTMRRRMLESTALELCYVAEGRFDAHYNNFVKPWDIAAGEVIVREAGGSVSELENEVLLVSNGIIHEGLIAAIQGV